MIQNDGGRDWFRRGFYFAAGVLALLVLLSVLLMLLSIPFVVMGSGGSGG
jgi:hypothetical protein